MRRRAARGTRASGRPGGAGHAAARTESLAAVENAGVCRAQRDGDRGRGMHRCSRLSDGSWARLAVWPAVSRPRNLGLVWPADSRRPLRIRRTHRLAWPPEAPPDAAGASSMAKAVATKAVATAVTTNSSSCGGGGVSMAARLTARAAASIVRIRWTVCWTFLLRPFPLPRPPVGDAGGSHLLLLVAQCQAHCSSSPPSPVALRRVRPCYGASRQPASPGGCVQPF